jgi:hypothetical protein
MANAMFAETLDNFQHSTLIIPESQIFTSNSSRVNLRARIQEVFVYCLLALLLSETPSIKV